MHTFGLRIRRLDPNLEKSIAVANTRSQWSNKSHIPKFGGPLAGTIFPYISLI
jgi:hypothetical protein